MRRFIPPRRGDLGEKWRYCQDCGVAGATGTGRLWPESLLVNDEGTWRCRQHWEARARYRTDGDELNLEDYADNE